MIDSPPAAEDWLAIRTERRRKGYTQRELAAVVGVSECMTRRFELGEYGPSEHKTRVAQAFVHDAMPKKMNYGRPQKMNHDHEARIKHALRKTTPKTVAQIASEAGVTEVTARRYLQAMQVRGHAVAKREKLVYEVPGKKKQKVWAALWTCV